MKRKFISTILVFLMIASLFATSVMAAQEASHYLAFYGGSITKSGSTIKVNFEVQGTNIMDVVGATEIYLYERSDSNSSWSLVETYLSSDSTYTSQMINTNSSIKHSHVSYSGSSSMQYMAYITCYAEKDGGSDSRAIIVYS